MGICSKENQNQKIDKEAKQKRNVEIKQKLEIEKSSKMVPETNQKLIQENNIKIFPVQKEDPNKIKGKDNKIQPSESKKKKAY